MRIIALILAFALLSPPAQSGTISRLYDFEEGTKAQADQVDAELDNILAAINGNISSVNILAGGVATANIATASVTHVKMGPLGDQGSASSGTSDNGSTTAAAVTNMTATITVYSRPVWVGLQPIVSTVAPGLVSYRNNGGGSTDNTAYISFQRDSVTRNQSGITARDITNSGNNVYLSLPCSSFWFLDDPGAGTYTYTAQSRVATGDDGLVRVQNCKLVVFEL